MQTCFSVFAVLPYFLNSRLDLKPLATLEPLPSWFKQRDNSLVVLRPSSPLTPLGCAPADDVNCLVPGLFAPLHISALPSAALSLH